MLPGGKDVVTERQQPGIPLPSHADPLIQEVSFVVNPGDRIALAGPNGSGKTTLLRILAGGFEPHAGAVVCRQQLRVSYVPQGSHGFMEERVEEYVLTAYPLLWKLHGEIGALELRLQDVERASHYADLLNAFEEQGGFRFQAEAKNVLEGLGFSAQERALPMAHLSSGQRARAELARLLLAPADLVLIGEPTDHLDIAAREWLEEYLARVHAAYLVVSHERVFLSRVATRIFELRRQTLAVYNGNFEFYLEQRAIREKQAWDDYAAQQRRIVAARQASERRMVLSRRVAKAPRGVRHGNDFYARKAAKVARTARILREKVARETVAGKPWKDEPIPSSNSRT